MSFEILLQTFITSKTVGLFCTLLRVEFGPIFFYDGIKTKKSFILIWGLLFCLICVIGLITKFYMGAQHLLILLKKACRSKVKGDYFVILIRQ